MTEEIPLPVPAPHLVGHVVIVTGSGRRLRDIAADPAANLGAVRVLPGGETGTLHTSPRRLFERLTSEWNSHLAVHDDTVARTGTNFHAVVHAQPPHLVYLSHVPAYQDLRITSTGGCCAGSPRRSSTSRPGSGSCRSWSRARGRSWPPTSRACGPTASSCGSKHGVMARSDISVTRAVDRIEYAETAARYEYMDLAVGGRAEGLTVDEMRAVVNAFDVKTTMV